MKVMRFIFLFFACSLFAKIQMIPVKPTVQPENVKIYIVFPQKDQILNPDEAWVQIKLRGYPLGVMTDNDRAKELVNYSSGQSIHVIIDNDLYFIRTWPAIDPYDEDENFYESMYKFKIPAKLTQGKHYIRVFPATSYGESLKEEGCFASESFFVLNKKMSEKMNLSSPYITFNEPSGLLKLKQNQPILLDYYVSNCVLSNDGYKLKVTIDKEPFRLISDWSPYYIYGLKKGSHSIRLQLVDKNQNQMPGYFNDITRKFYVN